MTFLYYLWVFCLYSDHVSFLQATKMKMLHYAHLIHAFFSGELCVLVSSCSMEYFQNVGSVELCKALLPTVSSVVFRA